jgi:hypothetical protein
VQFKAQEDDRQHLIRWGEGMQKQQLLQHKTATLLNTCSCSSAVPAPSIVQHTCAFFVLRVRVCAGGPAGRCWG